MSRRWVILIVALAGLALPALAQANAYTRVSQLYTATGTIPPCRFTSATLTAALKEAPIYEQEYVGEISSSIQLALSEIAAGRCARSGTSGLGVTMPNGPAAGGPRLPASVTSATGGGTPFPLLLALILAALGAGLGAAVAVIRFGGWDPAWLQAVRHSWGEAELRLSGSWSDLRDRLS